MYLMSGCRLQGQSSIFKRQAIADLNLRHRKSQPTHCDSKKTHVVVAVAKIKSDACLPTKEKILKLLLEGSKEWKKSCNAICNAPVQSFNQSNFHNSQPAPAD